MRIETKAVREGKHIGETVWICHYNRPDLHKKPLRNIPPTRVRVVCNEELPKSKRVYYSSTHFRPVNSDGSKITARVISPVDNTGYRTRAGNELHVFADEKSCKDAWNEQLNEHIKRLQVIENQAAEYWKGEKDSLAERVLK